MFPLLLFLGPFLLFSLFLLALFVLSVALPLALPVTVTVTVAVAVTIAVALPLPLSVFVPLFVPLPVPLPVPLSLPPVGADAVVSPEHLPQRVRRHRITVGSTTALARTPAPAIRRRITTATTATAAPPTLTASLLTLLPTPLSLPPCIRVR